MLLVLSNFLLNGSESECAGKAGVPLHQLLNDTGEADTSSEPYHVKWGLD
jgi:hypothetical protein